MNAKPVWIALASCLLTLGVVFVALNLASGEKKIERQLERLYAADEPQFKRAMGALLGPPVVDGNQTEVLLNGDAIFAAMLEAITHAQRTITFETYIYWSETIGREFADALIERARAGVKVHVLLDWVGSAKMEAKYLADMKAAGIEVERFHEPHWSNLQRMNNRTHRKLLVVDGEVGFTGGVGIADKWRGNAQDQDHWRETHFRVEGPVVAQMQSVFMDNWLKATGHVLHGEAYFPALRPRGGDAAQMFSSSPTGGSESMHLMYLLAITAATRSIHLSNSYFVPDELVVNALVAAARRGVKVQIIVPGPVIDTSVVRRASRARWGPLLEAGIQIAEYQPTMFHCKVLVIDALMVSQQQVEIFERDLQRSRIVSLAAWHERPWREKALEQAAFLLGSQL